MGTSASFGGQPSSTSLLPSWADPAGLPSTAQGEDQPAGLLPHQSGEPNQQPLERPAINPPSTPQRFRPFRANFSKFISSGGSDRKALGRSLGSYVRTASGGARTAARRIGRERAATSQLVTVLRSFQTTGVAQTLQRFSLAQLANQQPKEVLVALIDVVCGPGGTIDEGIARSAYVDALVQTEIGSLESLSEEKIKEISTQFVVNAISLRICNDIGKKLEQKAISETQAISLEKELNDFIQGAVKDILGTQLEKALSMTGQALDSIVLEIYELAFSVIEQEGAKS